MHQRASTWLTAVLLFGAASDVANSQTTCPRGATALSGNQVYISTNIGLVPLQPQHIESARRTSFNLYYVIQASTERSGAIVIKSARFGVARDDDVPQHARVNLKRKFKPKDFCDEKAGFNGSVPLNAYKAYHDIGQDTGGYLGAVDQNSGSTAQDALKRFHVQYEATDRYQPAGKKCVASDSSEGPSGFFGLNNRSQFSFDTRITNEGITRPLYSLTAGLFGGVGGFFTPGPSEAAGQTVREHHVEIKTYATRNLFACIPFSINVRAPLQILRINDLEARHDAGSYYEFRIGPR